jgi:hypothetical protein
MGGRRDLVIQNIMGGGGKKGRGEREGVERKKGRGKGEEGKE